MRKLLLFTALLMLVFGVSSNAAVYQFMPTPADLYDLDHDFAYTWGVDWANTNERIFEARLTFFNIHDYRPEENDILYVNLMDNATSGLTEYYDNEDFGDYFSGQDVQIGTWSDPAGSFYGPGVDVTFNFDADMLGALNSFAADGNFGLSFDPDCHYFNDGVQFTIITDVPEPSTFILLGIGAVGLAAFRRKH